MGDSHRILAVVLAAGGSSRFAGGAKQLAPIDGRPMVDRAVAAAVEAGGFVEVIVVAGAVELASSLTSPVRVLRNDRWAEGQATSLAVAIAEARRLGVDAVVVGLADQPGITAADWRMVADAQGPHPIVVATHAGLRGNPVRLDASIWDELPSTGDAGARVVMARRPDLVGEVACPGDPRDVDTREDLEPWN